MIAQITSLNLIDILAIILAVVSLTITIVGFFASLKFYRDGVELQNKANNALTKIEEKTHFIQTQVGGMFDKTLDAAIGKRELLSSEFEEINLQLEEAKEKIINESVNQIGEVGKDERERIKKLVENQISQIKEKVTTTKKSAEEIIEAAPELHPKESSIFRFLQFNRHGMNSDTIATTLGIPKISAPAALDSLLKKGLAVEKDGKYFPTNKET